MRPRHIFLCVIAIIALTATPSFAQPQLLGADLMPDAAFYGNTDWTNKEQLRRTDRGGRLHVHIRNTGATDLVYQGFTLGGKTFDQLTTESVHSASDTKWHRFWPPEVAPGESGSFTLRLVDLEADMPAGAGLVLQTSQGTLALNAEQLPDGLSRLRLAGLNFSEDLSEAIVFLVNRAPYEVTVPASGAVLVNGIPVSYSLPATSLPSNEVLPLHLTGLSLTKGNHAVFSVFASGLSAHAGLRVFAHEFVVQSHMQGGNFDAEDRARHFVGDWANWIPEIVDEPSGRGLSAMEVVNRVTDWLTDDSRPDQDRLHDAQTTVHNTSYQEGLVYDDIADVANSHWGNTRQHLGTFLTSPKANWYMPQNSWGHNEGLYLRESWPSLEDLRFQAFEAVGQGAKSIQWFLYQTHWRQGWGRREGTDFARIYQDKQRSGHIANPVVWDRIGRVSGALWTVKHYLTNMVQSSRELQGDIEVNVLACRNTQLGNNADRAVIMAMDWRTPRRSHAGYPFRYGTPQFEQQRSYDVEIEASLPAYMPPASHAFFVDPFLGVLDISGGLVPLGGNRYRLTLPQVDVASMVVLGNAMDGLHLQQRWNAEDGPGTAFASYGDLPLYLTARAANHSAGNWPWPELSRRKTISVSNDEDTAISEFIVSLDLDMNREFNAEACRVVEILPGGNRVVVEHSLRGTEVYEEFESGDITRFNDGCVQTYAGGCDPGDYKLEMTGGLMKVISYNKSDGFYWGFDARPPAPWQSWPPGEPQRRIPGAYQYWMIDADLSNMPYHEYVEINFHFYHKDTGEHAFGRGFQLVTDSKFQQPLDDTNGMTRYFFDIEEIFQYFKDNPPFGGPPEGELDDYIYYGSPASKVLPGWGLPEGALYSWSIDKIQVSGGGRISITPSTPLQPGETRQYEIYYDYADNYNDHASSMHNDALGVGIGAETMAPVEVLLEGTGLQLQFASQNVRHCKVFVARQGEAVLELHNLLPFGGQALTQLGSPLAMGDILAVVPVLPGESGAFLLFDHKGQAYDPMPQQEPKGPQRWARKLASLNPPGGAGLFPTCVDMSADGQQVAVGLVAVDKDREWTQGMLRILNAADGSTRREFNFPGKVFFVRFAPDSKSVYVAANLGQDEVDPDAGWIHRLYENTHIVKYDLQSGVELWRHRTATGVPESDLAEYTAEDTGDRRGRTVFDLEVFANGDVLYSEWNANAVKLAAATGRVLWTQSTGGGNTYTPQVVALPDGTALAHGFYCQRMKPDGTRRNQVFMSNHPARATHASADASLWALAGNSLFLLDNPPEGEDFRVTGIGSNMTPIQTSYDVGRYPRALKVRPDGQRIVTGSSDGQLTVLSRQGTILWTSRQADSMIADLALLPYNQGFICVREKFDYSHVNNPDVMGWRYREVTEAYTWAGKMLWEAPGSWRESEPFMSRLAVDGKGRNVAVLSGEEVRLVQSSGAATGKAAVGIYLLLLP